jgi:uncharacterized YigZ family protein
MQELNTYVLTEKKSKFIAHIYVVSSENEVQEILATIKKEYKDAKHIVYAYRLLDNGQIKAKYTDNKEPQGTAGRPILYLLEQKNLTNILAIVVRYFGGTLLGKGGLVRAYSNSVKNAIEGANL